MQRSQRHLKRGKGVVQLVTARPSVREVSRSIPGDITSLFQFFSFLCSFN